MKTFNIYFTNKGNLEKFLRLNNIADSKSILIQVFTGLTNKNNILDIIACLKVLLPSAKIIGATTDGEISNGKVSTNKTVLSISLFEKTTICVALIKRGKNGRVGARLASKIIKKNSKVIIAFADGIHTNGDNFLDEIDSIDTNIIVAGGLAAANEKAEKTYVFTEKDITENGAVGASLNSNSLHVTTDYTLNWQPVGKEMTITKSKENVVYTIDDKKAYDVYEHFLGKNMAQKLPSAGIEFPLIKTVDGINTARAILGKNSDGSLVFAGNLKKGDKVRVGFGSAQRIIQDSFGAFKKLDNTPIESIFIYSCMARRRFLHQTISAEISPFQKIAPTSGFFSYGEFYTKKDKKHLNQAMTSLVLSESDKKVKVKHYKNPELISSTDSITALSHIINTTTNELKETNKRLKDAIDGSRDGLWEWNILKNTIFFSERLKEILGYKNKELKNNYKSWLRLVGDEDRRYTFNNLKKSIKSGKYLNIKHKLYKKDLSIIWVHNRSKISYNAKNRPEIITGFITDITKEVEAEQEIQKQKDMLHYQAYHDTLTNLPNKALFLDRLKQAIKKAKRSLGKVAVFFIDLDNFKHINDSMGHHIGDKVLIQVASRLQGCMRNSDTVARLGGDEFIIIIDDIKNDELVISVVQKLIHSMLKPLHVKGRSIHITHSTGISIFPDNGYNANMLLKNADAAMYKAKESGKNSYRFYKDEMSQKALQRVELESSLRQAFKKEEFLVYYQPQVHTKTQNIVGVEALVRWNKPGIGLVSPDKFIPLLEETGLIVKLDRWVMKTAMKQIKIWNKEVESKLFLSLNLAMKQLEQKDFVEFVNHTLDETGCKPSYIEFEITENYIMKDTQKCIKVLNEVRDLGINISVDDFGTGYSSLSYLKKLPIRKIKIDQSFVRDIPKDKDDEAIIKAIISIAKNLSLVTVAEGVETSEQREFMLKHGCDKIQGYFYSKPLCAKDMSTLLTKGFGC